MKPCTSSWLVCVVLAVSLGAMSPGSACAQRTQPATLMLSGMFGTGNIDGELGLTGGVGVAVGTTRYLIRTLFDLHLLEPDDSDYSWEYFGSEGAECRDNRSGLIVDSSLCAFDRALTGISTDGSLIIPAFGGGFHLGAGYRLGSGSTAYAIVGYGFNPGRRDWNLLFRVIGGRELLGFQAVGTISAGWR